MPSLNTLQIIGLFITGGLLITCIILLKSTLSMKTKIYIIDNRIVIEPEIEEKLELDYYDEFEGFELAEDQVN